MLSKKIDRLFLKTYCSAGSCSAYSSSTENSEQATPASTEKDAKDARPSASSACRATRGTRQGAEVVVAPPVKSSDPRSNGTRATRATRTHQRRAMLRGGFVLVVFGGTVVVIGY